VQATKISTHEHWKNQVQFILHEQKQELDPLVCVQ